MVDDPSQLPHAKIQETIFAQQGGYIAEVAADIVGIASLILGAGRATKEDIIDLAVGLVVHVKVGDYVQHGDPLVTIHANDETKLEKCKQDIQHAFSFHQTETKSLSLFYDILTTV
jgi:pyrimidine-nucleoside phosphorylase